MLCCRRLCGAAVLGGDARVEVKADPEGAPVPSGDGTLVAWKPDGGAVLHRACWDLVVTSTASKKRKRSCPETERFECRLVSSAQSTAEFHDGDAEIEAKATDIAVLLRSSRRSIAFTGAGISTSAGIGDYRGKDGKWTLEDRVQQPSSVAKDGRCDVAVAAGEAVEDEEVDYENLRPTYAHEALSLLVQRGFIAFVVTQNCDGLHGLSGIPKSLLAELHGNVFVEKCSRCGHLYERPFYTMNDEWSEYYEEWADSKRNPRCREPAGARRCSSCKLTHSTGRKCDSLTSHGKPCGGALEDTIINFGDKLSEAILSRAEEESEKSELIFCIGSTVSVTPASDLVNTRNGRRLVVCNRQRTPLDVRCGQLYRAPKSERSEMASASTSDTSTSAVSADAQLTPKTVGVRVFGDCDRLMRILLRKLLPEEEVLAWEAQQPDRMKTYSEQRVSERQS
eukprot:NODE_1413_length_1542_cov_25.511052_g1274_i0.p1 GENE.NODE_1413_length_1542_cov_25.511052_g1274_i0~~NODE_1413_length_1542_cov_25.511052_g1274_i0.p1  ORF type:complete len:452 (+),score=72.02 NODE_1413_length_1542_cov_25.511052_g1274_i0:111-1466(+)